MKTQVIQAGLNPSAFERIKSGQKKMEFRLRKGKWANLKAGDIIEFGKEPDRTEVLRVQAVAVLNYTSFRGLFEHFDPGTLNQKTLDEQMEALLREYRDPHSENYAQKDPSKGRYSWEDEARYGVLGILVRVL